MHTPHSAPPPPPRSPPHRDAKVSVLEWDSACHTLHTSSLHYFEADQQLRGGRVLYPAPPRIVADPTGRCAAALIYNHHLALLPAMEVG